MQMHNYDLGCVHRAQCVERGGFISSSGACVAEGEITTRCFRYGHPTGSHFDDDDSPHPQFGCYEKFSGTNYGKRACVPCPTGSEQLYVEDRALVLRSTNDTMMHHMGNYDQARNKLIDAKLDKEMVTVQLRPFNDKQTCTAVFKSGMEFLTVTDESGKKFDVVINFMKLSVCKSKKTKKTSFSSGSSQLGEGAQSGQRGQSYSSSSGTLDEASGKSDVVCAVEKSIGRCLVGAVDRKLNDVDDDNLSGYDGEKHWSTDNLFAGNADCAIQDGQTDPCHPNGVCTPRAQRTTLQCAKRTGEPGSLEARDGGGYVTHCQKSKGAPSYYVPDESTSEGKRLIPSNNYEPLASYDAQDCGSYCKCNKGWSGNKCQIPDSNGQQNVKDFRRRRSKPNKQQNRQDVVKARKNEANWPLVPCDATWTSEELQNAGKLALTAAAAYV